jgi:hypothetical protein
MRAANDENKRWPILPESPPQYVKAPSIQAVAAQDFLMRGTDNAVFASVR